jgi:hypothetical protein
MRAFSRAVAGLLLASTAPLTVAQNAASGQAQMTFGCRGIPPEGSVALATYVRARYRFPPSPSRPDRY